MSLAKVILLTALITIVLFAAGGRWYLANRKPLKLNLATLISGFWSLVIAVLLLECVFYWKPPSGADLRVPCLLAGLAGASFGWILGMWISPLGSTESIKFNKYWTAIGVGSGFTLKWAMDKAFTHAGWFKANWLETLVFVIACLVTVAAVYNSRAYDDSLEVYLRPDPGNKDVTATDPITLKSGAKAQFYAAVSGPSDPLCKWQVIPDSGSAQDFGQVDQYGLFIAGTSGGQGRIAAFNIEDPTLSNSVRVVVAAAAIAS